MSSTKLDLPSLAWQKELFGVTDDNFHILTDLYNVSQRMLKESVRLFQAWYDLQPHFPKILFDDRTVERLLSANKFSVERSKEKLENLFMARNVMPEFFEHRDPGSPEVSKAIDSIDWVFMPKLTPENYRVLILRLNPDELDSYDPATAFVSGLMVADVRVHLDIVVGDIFVWDLKHLKFSHAIRTSPVALKKMMFLVEQCYGSHIRGFHLLNLPPYAEFLVTALKAGLKKKVADRVFIHKSMEDLFKEVPKDHIPKDMGGEFPRTCREISDNMKKVIRSPEWRRWYLDSVKYRTDETKRKIQSETRVDDLLGLMGTFRKLDID